MGLFQILCGFCGSRAFHIGVSRRIFFIWCYEYLSCTLFDLPIDNRLAKADVHVILFSLICRTASFLFQNATIQIFWISILKMFEVQAFSRRPAVQWNKRQHFQSFMCSFRGVVSHVVCSYLHHNAILIGHYFVIML